jgi:thioredoxin 1
VDKLVSVQDLSDSELTQKLSLLAKDKPVYLYCLSGSRSRIFADYMVKNGFSDVYNLQHGVRHAEP